MTTINIFDRASHARFTVANSDGEILFAADPAEVAVVEAVGFDWSGVRDQLFDALATPGRRGVVCVLPWHPGKKRLLADLTQLITDLQALPGSDVVFGSFPLNRRTLEQLWSIRIANGEWASGEWCIGSSALDLTKLNRTPNEWSPLGGFPDGFVLKNVASFGCALAMSEQQQSLLVGQPSERLEVLLESIRHLKRG